MREIERAFRDSVDDSIECCRSEGVAPEMPSIGNCNANLSPSVRGQRMLKVREELLAVEEDRLAGRAGTTPDELDAWLESVLDEAER